MPVTKIVGPDDGVDLTIASQDEVARLKDVFGSFESSSVNSEVNGEENYFPFSSSDENGVQWENSGGSIQLMFATGKITYHSPDFEEDEWSIKFIGIEEE